MTESQHKWWCASGSIAISGQKSCSAVKPSTQQEILCCGSLNFHLTLFAPEQPRTMSRKLCVMAFAYLPLMS